MQPSIDYNLELFREMISCCHDLFFWSLDDHLQPLYTNNPDTASFQALFHLDLSSDDLLKYARTRRVPMTLINSFGLIWIAAPEHDDAGSLKRIHVIGPAFYNDISIRNLETALNRHTLSLPLKLELLRQFEKLPVISLIRFLEYGQMLHYCITGEKITASDLYLYPDALPADQPENVELIEHHGTWASEQEMLKLVETGNLNYRHKMDRLASTGNVGKMSNGDPLRQAKNSVIIFTALCARAAIRGGLSPETAYSLSDKYIQTAEACTSFSQVSEISSNMVEDFILRVHQCRSSTVSPQIQECCDYIHLHLEKKIHIEQLASRLGYSKYYLSKKFRQETGFGIREYINQAKMEKAQDLLTSGKYSIQEISDILGFHSQSYFGELFHNATGMTPGEYRDRNQKKG